MAQDYIKRAKQKKAPAKKKNTQSRAQTQTSGADLGFKIRLILVLGLVAGFGYFLTTISGQSEQASSPTPVPDVPKKTSSLPPKPEKEKWEYMQTLPKQDVKAPSYDVEAPKGPFRLQCGSFGSQQNAEKMKAQIAFLGLESQIRKSTTSSKYPYRVILGPYERKRSAQSDRNRLKANGINTCKIYKWT